MKTIIHTIHTKTDKSITFTLKRNALNIFEEPQNNLWTFDLQGRLVGMFINNNNYRRTLDNKFYLKTRLYLQKKAFRQVKLLPQNDSIPMINRCHGIIETYQNKLPDEFIIYLDRIIKLDYLMLERDAEQFSKIYLPISILPPDQYLSLVVQLTEGCNYNQCTFCNFYKDRSFKIKSTTELNNHIQSVKSFFGEGLNLRKSIFLADANAISVPQNRLVDSLKLINNEFLQLKNIFSFVDVFTGLKKSAQDFKQLNELGIKRVYLGVESGNNDLMSFLNKQQLNSDIVELTQIIKAGGINVGVILLVGAGGEQFAEKHSLDSIKLLKQLPLSKGDIIYLSELYETNSDYNKSMAKINCALPTRMQIRNWSNTLKSKIKVTVSKDIKVSVYDINQFFY